MLIPITRARAGAALEAGMIRARRSEIPDTRLIEILLDALSRAGAFTTEPTITKAQAYELAQIVATNAGVRCGAWLGVAEAWTKVGGE